MNTGSVLAQFTITLSQAVSEQVAVEWHTADGTALAGVDYAAAKGTVLFAPGQTAKIVEILVHGRAVGSEDRSFFVEMLPPTNAILGASIGECIIHVDTTGSTPVTQIIVPTGPRGLQGDSAYQAWLDLGNTGTEQDFINSLKPSAAEIAKEVAPLIDLSNSQITAEGTETLSKPDTITGKRLARRVAYVGAAKVATVVLADGDNLIANGDLAGDAVDFNSISLYPRILRGAVFISPEWSVEQSDKLLVKSAVAGDVLYVCQYDVTSDIAIKGAVDNILVEFESNVVKPIYAQSILAVRRSCAEAGFNLVDGSFELGGVLVNHNDVLIQRSTGKIFSGPAGQVAAGTNPATGGFVDRSAELLRASLGFRVIDYLPVDHVKDGSVDYISQVQQAVDAAAAVSAWLEWPDFPIGVSAPAQTVPPEQHPYILLARNNTLWKSRANIKLLPQSTPGYSVIRIRDVDNVYLHRPKVQGDKATHVGVDGEWGYGIEVGSGATNVEIFEPETQDCWGDGIYIGLTWGETRPDAHPKNVTVVRPKDYGARRNAISFTSGVNVTIHHPEANDVNGVAPGAAIDVEPENKSGAGFTKAKILRSRIIGGVAKNCSIGLDIPIFSDFEVDLVHEGAYVSNGCPVPFSFISPAKPVSGAVSTIVLGELVADAGVVNISPNGCHNFDIKSLRFLNNSPVLSVTNQGAPTSQALVMGLKIRNVVYKDGLLKQLGLVTDSLVAANLPVFIGTLSIASDTSAFAYVYLDTNIGNAVYSEGMSLKIKSMIEGAGAQGLTTKAAGDIIELGGAPGYSVTTVYVNTDRRKITVRSSPSVFSDTGNSVVITSQTGATFYYNTPAGGVASGASVTLTTRQRAEINWIPGTGDYAVRLI